MRVISLASADDFEGWRAEAKRALADRVTPQEIVFESETNQHSLLPLAEPAGVGQNGSPVGSTAKPPTVPKDFLTLARQVACHNDPERFALLYGLLVRLQKDKTLLRQVADSDVHRVKAMAKDVRRDMHKMTAFVRFRKVGETREGTEQFVAWFEPSHHIVRLTAPFFMRRFGGMHWSILTPEKCAHWEGSALRFSPGVPKTAAPVEDALEDYWRSYYASIFNPARLKIDAMTSEMPKKYWKNLPEADLIPGLIEKARSREQGMLKSKPSVPRAAMMAHREIASPAATLDRNQISNLNELNRCLTGCRACPLWHPATQAVFGSGPKQASIMLVGEQPGDMEDLKGEPFVGPAGQLLRHLMRVAGLEDVYLTNAVKHFKFAPRGKRRLHKNPSAGEIDHCSWWLRKEIDLVQPRVIVAMGASAVRGITGKSGSIGQMRGAPLQLTNGALLIVTRHPSSVLRLPSGRDRQAARRELAEDLKRASEL